MAKLTESYLRGMIKQVIKEAGTTPRPPAFQYNTPSGEPIDTGEDMPISSLWNHIGQLADEENYPELQFQLKQLIDHPQLDNEDLLKIADAVHGILMQGSMQSASNLEKSERSRLSLGNKVYGVQESRKRK